MLPVKKQNKNLYSWEDQDVYSRWLDLFRRKLIGSLVQRGLRHKAILRFNAAMVLLKSRHRLFSSTALLATFLRISPELHLKGGSRRPYAAPVTEHQRVSLAVRWLIKPLRDSQKRRNVSARRLADAIEDSLLNRGNAIKQKKKIYRNAASHKHQRLSFKYQH